MSGISTNLQTQDISFSKLLSEFRLTVISRGATEFFSRASVPKWPRHNIMFSCIPNAQTDKFAVQLVLYFEFSACSAVCKMSKMQKAKSRYFEHSWPLRSTLACQGVVTVCLHVFLFALLEHGHFEIFVHDDTGDERTEVHAKIRSKLWIVACVPKSQVCTHCKRRRSSTPRCQSTLFHVFVIDTLYCRCFPVITHGDNEELWRIFTLRYGHRWPP